MMHKPVACSLLCGLTIPLLVFTLFCLPAAAAEPVIFDSDLRAVYEQYAQDPAAPAVCETCGGTPVRTDRLWGLWTPTGVTRPCDEGAAYSGLDMLEANPVADTYVCPGCGASTLAEGYVRRWVCYDPDGCPDCGGRRSLQSSEPGAWSPTGAVRSCTHGGTPYYNDVEAARSVRKTFVCETCGAAETRTDRETVWLCTDDEEESRIVCGMI